MEVTVEECLGEETDRIEHIIFDYYFKRNYNPDVVTLREYANMKKKFKADSAKIQKRYMLAGVLL